MGLLSYIDKLQRANADDLAFYPLTTLEKAVESGHVLVAYQNDEPCGYLWFGAVRAGYPVTIYQACIDYEARQRHHGWKLVGDLMQMGGAASSTAIRLKCASSADSNEFWRAIGFMCTNVTQGGVKRARDLNHWYAPLAPMLFQPEELVPSTKAIDLTAYKKAKLDGVAMPSRFSRSHY